MDRKELMGLVGDFDRRLSPTDIGPGREQMQARWNAIEMRDLWRSQGKNLVAVITERVRKLEANLKEDEELVVYCDAGLERIRATEFEFPTWHLAIVSGLDENNNPTQRIENVQDIKLTCKVLKTSKAARTKIGFTIPSEK
jgi:hypothetical protein